MALNDGEIAVVKGMLTRGDRQHDIAAYFGINGGRIGEISTGQTGGSVAAAPAEDLRQPVLTWPDDRHSARATR